MHKKSYKQNGNGKTFFMNVSKNLRRQPSKGEDNQVVKIVVPKCRCRLKKGADA